MVFNLIQDSPNLPLKKLIKIAQLGIDGCDVISDHVESIVIVDPIDYSQPIEHKFYIYNLVNQAVKTEYFDGGQDLDEKVEAGLHWLLPSREFEGLYESLIYEEGVKEKLLKIVETTMLFSRRKVDPNVICCNRLALLWGPPGTGKTSLCKAITQKLAIHMGSYYQHTHLVEINCHSLFSKWFSESGKLVMQLFERIRKLLETPSSLICIVIDEVESIAYARSAVSSSEPTDSLRVVNAVLTQLDRIRHHSNVLILSTSNVTQCLDAAFIDRADIVQYIGPPSEDAIAELYRQAIHELKRVRIIIPSRGFDEVTELKALAAGSLGLSGRTVRKIPFLAHALYTSDGEIDEVTFFSAMSSAILKQLENAKMVSNGGYLVKAQEVVNGQNVEVIGFDDDVNGIMESYEQFSL